MSINSLSFSSEVSPIPFGFLIWTMITWPPLRIHFWKWMQWCKIHRNFQWCKIHRNFQYLHPSMHPASRILLRKAKS
jgi:hypothetical protein